MSRPGCGKRNCRCKSCQKVLVLKLKDLDKTTRMNQVRECLLDLYIKPNPNLKSGQLVTFQDDIHDIYGNGLLQPIKINVEVPVEVSKTYGKKENGIWFLGKSKKGYFLLVPTINYT